MAQYHSIIHADRPSQAFSPYTVGKSVLQFQTGLDLGGYESTFFKISQKSALPNTYIRYGLTNHFEINTNIEYRFYNTTIRDKENSSNRLTRLYLGTRYNILEGHKGKPAIGLQVGCKIPIGYGNYYLAPQMLLIVNQNLTKKLSFLTNLGLSYTGYTLEPVKSYVVNLGYSFSPKWSLFIENYGHTTHNNFETRWDCGLAFIANPNLQFDLYGGIGNNNDIFDYFTSIGFSWRVKKSHKNYVIK